MSRPLPFIALLCAAAACDKAPAGTSVPDVAGLCGSAPAAATSPAAGCSAYVDAFQAYAARCGADIDDLDNPDFVQACVALTMLPGSAFSPARLAACAARVRTVDCAQSLSETCECGEVGGDLRGTLADGASCLIFYQCASGNCAGTRDQSGATTCGRCAPRIPIGGPCDLDPSKSLCETGSLCAEASHTCVAQTIGKAGVPCTGASVRCDTGLRCSPPAGDGGREYVCARPAGLGEPCGTCGGALRCISGTCRLPSAAGGPCKYDSDCASGLACDDSDVCVARKLLAAGETCGQSGAGSCGAGLYCPFGAGAVCTAYAAKGAPCATDGPRCAPYFICWNGRCSAIDGSLCR